MSSLKTVTEGLSDTEIGLVLIENRQNFLRFLTRRLGSLADAEDVLQDFNLKVLSRQKQLRNAGSLVAWLYSILRTSLADHYRKQQRQGKIGQALAGEMTTAEEPGDIDSLQDSLCACLHTLLPALRPDQAKLVHRIDLAEEERRPVAEELGVSLATLAVKLHRARQALRRALLTTCASCLKNGFDDCGCNSGKKNAATTKS